MKRRQTLAPLTPRTAGGGARNDMGGVKALSAEQGGEQTEPSLAFGRQEEKKDEEGRQRAVSYVHISPLPQQNT